MEVAFHIHKKNGHINKVFPFASRSSQYVFDVVEYISALSLEIERDEIPVFVYFQSWNRCVTGIASCNARTHT